MYGAGGERRLSEYELDWLPGYEGSTPVRVGNAASEQFQLDVYGEVLASLSLMREAVGESSEGGSWDFEVALLEYLEGAWHQPDDGIWEVRGGRQHFTHSKVMAWVGVRPRGAHGREDRAAGPDRPLAAGARRHPRAGVRRGLRRREGRVHAGVRLEGDGRVAAHAADVRVPARGRPAHRRHGRRDRARAAPRRLRAALPTAPRSPTACPPARACSSRARSGSPTTT